MRRFVLREVPPDGATTIPLGPEEFRYVVRVLRRPDGDRLRAIDGTGRLWEGTLSLTEAGAALCEVRVVEQACREVPLIVCAALVKAPRWESLIEACSELGATDLLPLRTARTVVRPDDARIGRQVERWQRIANESAKQCERLVPLTVHAPVTLEEALDSASVATRLLIDETARARAWTAADARSSTLLLVGPEGGFTESERAAAHAAGCVSVGLGRYVLRSATAAAAALTLVRAQRDALWES